MKNNSLSGSKTRIFALSAIVAPTLLAGLFLSTAASAQGLFEDRQNIYIDGSTPVDARTRALVDAHFDQIENRQLAKAEERERLQRFIYHDNTFGAQQFGRW